MAFSFSNAAAGAGTFGSPSPQPEGAQAQDGVELQEIQTDKIGFQSIAGDSKLKLVPSWPPNALPPPTSSLLSVASSKGLIAAAGPETLVIASTESVRNAFRDGASSENNVKAFEPQVRLPVPRLSQLAFSTDENVLVISAQEGGGLAVYQTDGLMKGQSRPVFQIATNNTGLRALVPNPSPDSAELFAAVTTNGELVMADLKSGQLKAGSNGPILKNGVSCVSWSYRGKQAVAGLADGTASLFKPDGTQVAVIPRPPSMQENLHISAISWLDNDSFFIVYTPNSGDFDDMLPSSEFYIVTRQPKTVNYTFHKLPDVCPPFGLNRSPSFQFVSRLRNFDPHLQELVLVASTTSIEIGVVSKSSAPLSLAEPVVDSYTLTTINDDTRRAQFPLSEDSTDTSPIGFALDLSSKENIVSPIPSDPEIQQSETPVPGLLVLNHEGVLLSWWIIYTDSIREKTAYASLVAAVGSQQNQNAVSITPVKPTSTTFQQPIPSPISPGFGQPSFPAPSPFAKPSISTFGAPATSSTFGTGSGNTFGAPSAPSAFGGAKSWTNSGFGQSTTSQPSSGGGFDQPAFGTPSSIGGSLAPSFGSTSALGSRPTPFGQPASSGPAFGQPKAMRSDTPFGGGSAVSPFAKVAANDPKTSSFASFSDLGGFSSLKTTQPAGGSPFIKPGGDSTFLKPTQPALFGSENDKMTGLNDTSSAHGGSVFGPAGSGFKLGSTFQGDGSAKDDLPRSANTTGSLFANGIENLLGTTQKAVSPTHDKEEDMDESDPAEHSSNDEQDERGKLAPLPPAPLPPNFVPPTPLPPAPLPPKYVPPAPLPPEPLPPAPKHDEPVVTPQSTVQQSKTTPAPALSTLFGTSTQPDTTPAAVQNSKPTWGFGTIPSTTPKESPKQLSALSFQSTSTKSTGSPKIKPEPSSDDESQGLDKIPEAPLPPDPTSKPIFSAEEASPASNISKTPYDDTSAPDTFVPANKSAETEEDQVELPNDDDFSSEFEGSGEDVTQDISPIEEPSAAHTEQFRTSPESSFGKLGGKNVDTSPTGGLFTKITAVEPTLRTSKPLFGEVGTGPIFPPPKPQESPRSPSPVRNATPNYLRPEASSPLSAPDRPSSVIEKRRAESAKSGLSFQPLDPEDERKKAQERAATVAAAKAKAEAEQAQQLEDDEDELLRAELLRPVSPSAQLDTFIPHQQSKSEKKAKLGIPGQIERLYQDINSMVDTLGINARALSAFMLYQQKNERNISWDNIVSLEDSANAIVNEWNLSDIVGLYDGEIALHQLLERSRISDVASKLQQCHDLLSVDLVQLRTKLISIRKTIHASTNTETGMTALLSAEQASLQHDLRKASASVQTKLAQAEQIVAILRAKLAENAPSHEKGVNGTSPGLVGRSVPQRKPTVEAVTNTIAKMTSMAEKKSVDIDFLEAQLKKLEIELGASLHETGRVASIQTPSKVAGKAGALSIGKTPASASGSVYHTPGSTFGGSTRSTPGTGRKGMGAGVNGEKIGVSAEDAERWKQKARRKRDVGVLLKEVLAERRAKAGKAS